MLHLAVLLDKADNLSELAALFPDSVDKVHRLQLKDRRYSLRHDPNVCYSGRHIHVKLAPVKEKASAVRKAMQIFDDHLEDSDGTYAKPACRYITDMIRARVVAADPYYLYLYK